MNNIQTLVKDFFVQVRKLGFISILLLTLLISISVGVFWYVQKSPTQYQVNSSFLVDNKSSSPTTLSALASQLGLPTNLGQFPSNQFLCGFLQSKFLYKSVLLSPYNLPGNNKIHNFAEFYESLLAKNKDSIFPIHAKKLESLSLVEDSMLSLLVEKLNKNIIVKNSDNVGCVNLIIKTSDRNFSVDFANEMLRFSDAYFVRYKLSQGDLAFNLSKRKIDSLHSQLLAKQYALAHIYDQSKLSVKQVDKVNANVLEEDIKALENSYSEAANNLDLSYYARVNQQNVLLIIDAPANSVEIIHKNPYIYSLISLLIGLFLFVLFVSSLNYLRNDQ